MTRILVSITDNSLCILIEKTLKLYAELVGVYFESVDDPKQASLIIADTLRRGYKPSNTILVGLEVDNYSCIKPQEIQSSLLRKIHMIVTNGSYEPDTVMVGSRRIPVKSIFVIETGLRLVVIRTTKGIFESRKSIKYWRQQLSMWPFYEVYRGILVNFIYVREIVDRCVVMKSGHTFPIARRRYQTIKSEFKRIHEKNY